MRVLEGRAGRVEREPGGGFDWRVGKVQLQGFTFACRWDDRRHDGGLRSD